eukprot:TRINITY_DN2573_c0_g1_i1.p1 TRINITY_DN2573_c0_g1~~TRINITY_DN2573_c0_g1_i1.p1  ORF type:complete len:262 (+),score=42.01 TRINITY_DN2573_c0_g1_i1:372-1157(+)
MLCIHRLNQRGAGEIDVASLGMDEFVNAIAFVKCRGTVDKFFIEPIATHFEHNCSVSGRDFLAFSADKKISHLLNCKLSNSFTDCWKGDNKRKLTFFKRLWSRLCEGCHNQWFSGDVAIIPAGLGCDYIDVLVDMILGLHRKETGKDDTNVKIYISSHDRKLYEYKPVADHRKCSICLKHCPNPDKLCKIVCNQVCFQGYTEEELRVDFTDVMSFSKNDKGEVFIAFETKEKALAAIESYKNRHEGAVEFSKWAKSATISY